MVRETFSLESTKEGAVLNVNIWYPEGKPKAVVQYMHGMMDQSRRHRPMGEYLAERGIVFVANDHLGHGQTMPEERGYFADKNGHLHLVNDQKIITDYVKKRFPGVPLFIMGQSMGSFIARNYISDYGDGIEGAIIASTAQIGFKVKFGLFATNLSCLFLGKHHVAKLINYFSMPYDKKFDDSKLPLRWLTGNYPYLKKMFKEYPGEFFTFKAGGFRDLFRLVIRSEKKEIVAKIPSEIPLLFVSGEMDCLSNCCESLGDAEKVYKNNGNPTEVLIYEGIRHDLEASIPEKYHEDVCNWILKRLG